MKIWESTLITLFGFIMFMCAVNMMASDYVPTGQEATEFTQLKGAMHRQTASICFCISALGLALTSTRRKLG